MKTNPIRRIAPAVLVFAAMFASVALAVPSGTTLVETGNECTPAAPGIGVAPYGNFTSPYDECMPMYLCGAATVLLSPSSLPSPGVTLASALSYSSYGLLPCGINVATAVAVPESLTSSFQLADSPAGFGWMQLSRPVIDLAFDGSPGSEIRSNSADRIILYLSPTKVLQFYRSSSNSSYFYGVNGAKGGFEHVARGGSDHDSIWKYSDPNGNIYYFFGFNTGATVGGVTTDPYKAVRGQLWKVVNADGGTGSTTAYLGNATSLNSAIEDGFYHPGGTYTALPLLGYDSAGRLIEYLYDSIGGKYRYTQIKTSASSTVVNQIDYEYYTSTVSNKGTAGDLKKVVETTYLSDGGSQVKTQYMRYYTGGWDSSTPGVQHQLRLFVDAEGCRRWSQEHSTTTLENAEEDDSDSINIVPYASQFITYFDADGDNHISGSSADTFRAWKVWTITSNTDCGCGSNSAPTDTLTLDYQLNGSAATTSSYDAYGTSGVWGTTGWRSRTIVANPDSSYKIMYLDEYNQKLADIAANGAPGGGGVLYWITRYERDTLGRIIRVLSPEVMSGYTHSTGAMTSSADTGLVSHMEYHDTLAGAPVTRTLHSKGTGGTKCIDTVTAYLDSGSNYYKGLGSGPIVEIDKLLPTSIKQYKTVTSSSGTAGTDYDETAMSYAFYSSSWLIKSISRTLSIVDEDNNGKETADAVISTYLRHDGRPIFAGTADNRYTFFEYDSTTGQLTRRVTDVNSSDSNASTANSTTYSLGLTLSSSGKNIATTYTYDAQGRNATTTLPTSRVMANWYTKLHDNRSVTLSVPRKVSSTYYGPVGYSVTNLAGNGEASGIITLAGSSNEAGSIASWIDTNEADPIEAVVATYGAVARLNVSEYIKNGTKPTKSRVIYALDTDVSGSDSDDSYVYYDSMGRMIRRVDATGTISRTVFDAIGRPYSHWIGTNDNGWSQGSSSGTNNMTLVSQQLFDNGSAPGTPAFATLPTLAVGNNRLTLRVVDEDGDWTGATDQRSTIYVYDYRGRMIVQENPVAPHSVMKYDNRGRGIASATYSGVAGLDAGTDPTSTATASGGATVRLSLNETFFDERGQVWKTLQHKVSQSAGTYSSGDDMITLNWYDKNGRSIKSTGPGGLRKIVYDRLDRAERRYSLAKIVDSGYDDADDVDGDTVLEEQLTNFDDATGVVLANFNLTRTVEASSYTGDLRHTTTTPGVIADTDLVVSSTIHARVQINAMYYDSIDRPVSTVQLGTESIDGVGSATFTRSTYGLPSASDTELVGTTTYNKVGTVLEVARAKSDVTRFLYDDAGRKTATISNYVNGTPGTDDDNYVRTVYQNGLIWKLWVDLDGDNVVDTDDQVTEYLYGTEKGTLGSQIGSDNKYYSQVATGHLLRTVIYPAQDGGSTTANRSVQTAYNALSEAAWSKDQNGTVIATDYDIGGRIVEKNVASLGTDVDGWVRRVVLDYTNRGQTLTVDQYAATSGGSPINGVKYTYDEWGNITQFDQDFDSAVASGANFKSVQWAYSRVAPTSGRLSYRRVSETLPDGSDISYDYGTSGGLDDLAGRVQSVSLDVTGSPVEIATYQYMGTGQVVKRALSEPNLTSLSGPSQLDRFNRIVTDAWSNGASNIQRFDISYDRNSNITMVKDPVLDNFNGSNFVNSFSTKFDMDGRNRVIKADRGVESGGNIGGSQRLDQLWTLSQTGNWTNFKNDFDGDSNGTDTDEVNEDRTFNTSNEILTRTDPSASLVHDRSGEMTDDGKNFKYVYDAFGRLKKVTDRAGTPVTIAEYKYNGLNQRIGWHYDVNASAAVTDSDPWYYFVYDDRWRIVNTYRAKYDGGLWAIDAYPKERFVHHAAGIDGRSGSSYIDSIILSDRDKDTDWIDEADSELGRRFYYLQNWRADTCALTDETGLVLRNFRYSAYGSRTEVDGGDYNRDGAADFFDYLDMMDAYSTSDMRADINKDGSLTGADEDALTALYNSDDDLLGGGTRNLYAGYENDPSLEKPAVSSGGGSALVAWESMYHVRNRVYSTDLGRWTRRDPIGYRGGSMDLFEYCKGGAESRIDPFGLECQAYRRSPSFPVEAPGSAPTQVPWGDRTWSECEKWADISARLVWGGTDWSSNKCMREYRDKLVEGCAHDGPFIWNDRLTKREASDEAARTLGECRGAQFVMPYNDCMKQCIASQIADCKDFIPTNSKQRVAALIGCLIGITLPTPQAILACLYLSHVPGATCALGVIWGCDEGCRTTTEHQYDIMPREWWFD